MDIALITYFKQIDYFPEPTPTHLPIVPPTTHHNRRNNHDRQQSNLQKSASSPTQIVDLSHDYSKRTMLGQTNCQHRNERCHNSQEAIMGALIKTQEN
jgi:3-deoxy-D-arabino-heptulosonate 7-phosphate (DAHP) synthase